ncbi:MAG: hypothetical protein J6S82_06550 [Bacteroidales bacterium]|nr:hypothetical protein [Bacteroidales bacterium]
MKQTILITALLLSLLPYRTSGQSYKGFDFYFNGGMYKGHSQDATYYNGGNDDIRIGRILGNSILKQEIDRLVAENGGVILDSKGVHLEEIPARMHYDWSFIIGVGFAYRLTPTVSLTGTVGQVKLQTQGTAVFGYNKGVSGNQTADYLHYPIIGREKRSFLEVGLRYMEEEERTCRWFAEMALQLNSVKIENADLMVEGKAFTMIDYYGGASYDPTIVQTEIDPMLGGVGFGLLAGGGVRLKINQWAALEPFAQLHYSRFHLQTPARFHPNLYLGIRIIVRDYLFA